MIRTIRGNAFIRTLVRHTSGPGCISHECYRAFSSKADILAHEIIGEGEDGPETKYAVVMHGIMGSKQNWRTFARRLTTSNAGWKIVLLDHRGHGGSTSMNPPHTVAGAGGDVKNLIDTLGLSPEIIIGHSFGGKVALEYVAQRVEEQCKLPKHCWVLDSMLGHVEDPEAYAQGKDSAGDVIRHLKTLPSPIPSKEFIVKSFVNAGFGQGVGLWMTTNISPNPDGSGSYLLDHDTEVIDALFDDYMRRDFWHLLQNPPAETTFHILRAAKNKAWDADIMAKLRSVEGLNVKDHCLEKAGHWVHVDNPDGLFDMINETFQ